MRASIRRGKAAVLAFAGDALLLSGLLIAVAVLRGQGVGSEPRWEAAPPLILAIVLGAGSTSVSAVLRRQASITRRAECALIALFVAAAGGAGVGFAVVDLADASASASTLVAVSALAGAVGALGWRRALVRIGVKCLTEERIVVLGSGPRARAVVELLARNGGGAAHRVIAVVSPEPREVPEWIPLECRFVGGGKRLDALEKLRAERVIVALEDRRGILAVGELLDLRLSGVVFESDTALFERVTHRLDVDHLCPSEILFADGFVNTPVHWMVKRLLDVVCSLCLLALSAPVMAVTALAIRLESPGAVLYRQVRTGRGGRPFEIVKFRSMVANAEADGRARWARQGDDRVTRVGAIIRKVRIDELPQLFTILKGDMSFVGPRPERPEFVDELAAKIPYYRARLFARPGLTGWAQVCYGYGASDDEAREKLRYDLYYLKHATALLDLRIVMQTVVVVLSGFGAR